MALISKSKIEEATARLVTAYQPEAIYLFGSYAWGEPNEDSDVDFFIILKDDADMAWDAFRIANRALKNIAFPIDVLINKHQAFEQRAEHPSTLEFKIKKEGILLHGNSRRMAA
jgi:uncharacterized protein